MNDVNLVVLIKQVPNIEKVNFDLEKGKSIGVQQELNLIHLI